MRPARDRHGSTDDLRGGGERPGGESFFALLRYSHIFASIVREILELKLLREVTPLTLTLSQFHLLKLISHNGQHHVGEVAEFLGVSPPAATKNVDKLERFDLVRRTPSRGDRRATLLSVSPKGRELVRAYEELKGARLGPVLERFRSDELEQLAGLLERFSVALLEQELEEDGICLRCAAYIDTSCPVGRVRGGCPYQKVRASRLEAGAPDTP